MKSLLWQPTFLWTLTRAKEGGRIWKGGTLQGNEDERWRPQSQLEGSHEKQ